MISEVGNRAPKFPPGPLAVLQWSGRKRISCAGVEREESKFVERIPQRFLGRAPLQKVASDPNDILVAIIGRPRIEPHRPQDLGSVRLELPPSVRVVLATTADDVAYRSNLFRHEVPFAVSDTGSQLKKLPNWCIHGQGCRSV